MVSATVRVWGILLFGLQVPFKTTLFSEEVLKYPKIFRTSTGSHQFGLIEIDQDKREFSFPAVCNQTSGLVEYALVHEDGKTHESLFRTKVSPKLIHASLLLLKEKPQPAFFSFVEANSSKLIQMPEIEIRVEWEHNGSIHQTSMNSMVLNQTDNRELSESAFVFTGSKVVEGTYLAEMDGSIVAVYHDNRATLNSRDLNSNSDDVWIANESKMPPKNLPVLVRFQLPKELD
jgi:hypothetical protein